MSATKILIKTCYGRLINYDSIIAIEPTSINVSAVINTSDSRNIVLFSGDSNQVETWMQIFQREFECAGNQPTYVIDVNDEAKGATQ